MRKKKEQQEQGLINHFLEYYNEVTGAKYVADQRPDVRNRSTKQPDFICKDAATGEKIAVEISRLPGPLDWKWDASASEFLREVSSQLEGKLPGTFLLLPDVEKIEFTQSNRKTRIDQLCQGILALAPSLAEGEGARLSKPFPYRLKREEAASLRIQKSQLLPFDPCQTLGFDPTEIKGQFQRALDEANEKFRDYSHLLTILLLGIWETGVEYDEFVKFLPSIDMNKYKNVKRIYLYNASPDTWIYHLWSHTT